MWKCVSVNFTFNDGTRPFQLELKNYYQGDEEAVTPNTADEAGQWALLRKARVAMEE